MVKTFGQLKATLSSWAREIVDDDVASDALNDAIERMWTKVIQAQIDRFVGGPVTINLALGSERTQLITIPDPTVAPTVNSQAGGALAQHTPFVSYTVVTESGSETNPSPIQNATVVPVNNVAVISAPARVPSAFGWNVYASNTAAANMARQNASPLEWSVPFVEPVSGFVDAGDDLAPGPLPPTENSTADDIFYIRRLESPLTVGGFRRWDQTSIDSMMFDFATRSIASTSEYQPYYWDLVNGRQLEYRPVLAMAFNPRHFYVHRPRRINFDTAPLPFTSFPCEETLRSYALAAWKRVQEEWNAANIWEGIGDKNLIDLGLLLRQEDWNKDTTVTPYIAGW